MSGIAGALVQHLENTTPNLDINNSMPKIVIEKSVQVADLNMTVQKTIAWIKASINLGTTDIYPLLAWPIPNGYFDEKKVEEKHDENKFDEANFKLDLKSYLWNEANYYDKMLDDKKNIFTEILTTILRANWKKVELNFDWDVETVETVEEIKFLMRSLVSYLYNLDFKDWNAVEDYENVLASFKEYEWNWLKIDDKIFGTLYWSKIFAEEVDFFRTEIDNKPWTASKKYAERAIWIEERLEKQKEEISILKASIESNKETLARLNMENEVLEIVLKWLKAMSSTN